MTHRNLALLTVLLPTLALAIACNEIDIAPAGAAPADESVAAERPTGWESLEDEQAGSRMYYQFVDARGSVRFVERMEDVPEQWRSNVGFVKMPVPPPLSPGDAARARATQVASRRPTPARPDVSLASAGPQIVLYSAEWCGACKKAKRYLGRNGIDFEERDVDVPSVANELMRKTGQRSIPVLDVDGRVYSGFSPGAYEDLLRG